MKTWTLIYFTQLLARSSFNASTLFTTSTESLQFSSELRKKNPAVLPGVN